MCPLGIRVAPKAPQDPSHVFLLLEFFGEYVEMRLRVVRDYFTKLVKFCLGKYSRGGDQQEEKTDNNPRKVVDYSFSTTAHCNLLECGDLLPPVTAQPHRAQPKGAIAKRLKQIEVGKSAL